MALQAFINQAKEFWQRLRPAQKLTIAVAVVGAIGILATVVTVSSSEPMAVLFRDLDPKDAGAILDPKDAGAIVEAGGAQIVASILNLSPPAIAKTIMEQIEQTNAQLAQDIKRMMFLFEDLLMIDDRGIQRILREVDRRDLVLALRGADERLRAKIFKNMSERAAKVVKEELELMGPVKLKDVEASQQRIVEVVKRLEEQEEITISGRGRDEVFI